MKKHSDCIYLPTHPEHDLDWSAQKAQAQMLFEKKEQITFFLQFGWEREAFPFNDFRFSSDLLAVEKFVQEFSEFLSTDLSKVYFYEGPAFFLNRPMQMEDEQWELFSKKFPEKFQKSLIEKVFAAESFSKYLHRLISFLPDSVQPYCIFHEPASAQIVQLFCKRRFELCTIEMHAAGFALESDFASDFGLVIPADQILDEEALQALDAVLLKLDLHKIKVRILPEEKINEMWNGLQALIVISKYISFEGKRRLRGFEAAGGEIIVVGERLNFLDEKEFDQFLQCRYTILG